ncbi:MULTISPECIES: hypothetical protein [unclassified Spirosoma]|uniref:hypothetical protein n=1 Tax=unclassified Spirosoma TaxID=2621999 RepID=UPI000958F15B|nr:MULTISPECIES: hypothetical protein [unclassified Spirosoma]MBN8821127.1 hypothetical protein [Spirosoma sp.]OJW79238.1 MAG: hypothetical protein BGO59_11890 [Spirosoma sp. 48-14]
MNAFAVVSSILLLGLTAKAQVLPHRMRVGLSADLLGATQGIGAQVHASFRFTDDYRAFDDRHQYINAGIGIAEGFTGPVVSIIGQTVPHYLTYGTGRGRAMVELGFAGVFRRAPTRLVSSSGQSNGFDYDKPDWNYMPSFLIGYRYTAYSGFLFRIHLATILPGVSIGWVF